MIKIPNMSVWIGNAADLRDIRGLLNCGISAIVDLAIEEPLPNIPRTTNYCRFSLTDDGENDPAVLRAAILSATEFIRGQHSVGICCNAGLNRSASITAAVISRVTGDSAVACLEHVAAVKQVDVNPALWNQVVETLAQMDADRH